MFWIARVFALALAGTAALALPTLTGPLEVVSWEEGRFTVVPGDAAMRAWEWSLDQPHGGWVVPSEAKTSAEAGFSATFTAAQVVLPREFVIQVRDAHDPSHLARRTVRVLPSAGVMGPLAAFFGGGGDWLRPVPKLVPFLGTLSGPAAHGTLSPDMARIAFMDNGALGPRFHRRWLVGDARGIRLIAATREIQDMAGEAPCPKGLKLEPFTCVALAVCAPGTPKEAPVHLVWAPGESLGSPIAHTIHGVDSLGGVRVLAGSRGRGFRNGPALEAQFRGITGLAMDATGTIFILDAGNRMVRTLSRLGEVATLAGGGRTSATGQDGRGGGASFLHPTAMTLDPATGDLYVLDCHAVRRVAPDGLVTTLLDTLLGNPHLTTARTGPLGQGEGCAAFPSPRAIAFNPEGVCMAVSDSAMVELDFPAPPA